MLLRVSDKASDISHKSIVLAVGIDCHHIVKILILDLPETQERYMLACVPSFAIAEKWPLRARGRRVVFSVGLPIEQIGDRPVIVVVVECPLVVTKELWPVRTEITSRNHCKVVRIRVMVEVAKIAEKHTFPSKAFE